jgi:aldose sugar dehydrogenase
MKLIFPLALFSCLSFLCAAQGFIRTELPTIVTDPFEITYGPDDYLWLTDSGGVVIRVSPLDGTKTIVYTAQDYFPGSPSEQSELCFQPMIGSGTLGLALHPDFENGEPYIYYVYSYNNGTLSDPETRFKIVRLTWDAEADTTSNPTDLILDLPTGYDHLGGRLIAVKRNETPYLFFSSGDNGISELNSPDCYEDQSLNPNNFVQDPNYKNGKIHRFNMDGSVPEDNPIPGNSFYTRGHRNPQGLIYNPSVDVLYDVEHGDRTDDEINVLLPGMNYGWKNVRGYAADENFPGELEFAESYVPDPAIPGDSLIEPIYSWCATTPSTSDDFLDWCTVAPSDGIYYASVGIPEWSNSLLVVTLKNGTVTDNEVYRFKLTLDGLAIEPSSDTLPNPTTYFGEDQALNGRLRDIAVPPGGGAIYLINNNDDMADKIIVYTYDPNIIAVNENSVVSSVELYPNPATDVLQFRCSEPLIRIQIYSSEGLLLKDASGRLSQVETNDLAAGVYVAKVITASGGYTLKRFTKQ